jgi:glucuronate isomerase
MLPAFRPDNALHIEKETFLAYIERLSNLSEIKNESFEELVNALKIRVEYFHNVGCRLSDHGLTNIPFATYNKEKSEVVFRKRIEGKSLNKTEVDQFKVTLLIELGKMYHQKGWVMQLHLGAIRNNNAKLLNIIGADVGCDSIGDYEQARGLSNFLNLLTLEDALPKTILYNLNPRDNEVFATMAGNFNNDGGINKVQWGSAWWFLDQKDGIEKQLNALSNMGLLSRFVGMLTDSRSFLSFPRHEYFRRILCNLLGNDMENGELPNDIDWIGKIVQDICYYNAKEYFEFS